MGELLVVGLLAYAAWYPYCRGKRGGIAEGVFRGQAARSPNEVIVVVGFTPRSLSMARSWGAFGHPAGVPSS